MKSTGKIIFFLILIILASSSIFGLEGLSTQYSENTSYSYSSDSSNIIINPAKINNNTTDQLSFIYEFDNSISTKGMHLNYIFKNPDSAVGTALGINYSHPKKRSDIYLSFSYELINNLSIGLSPAFYYKQKTETIRKLDGNISLNYKYKIINTSLGIENLLQNKNFNNNFYFGISIIPIKKTNIFYSLKYNENFKNHGVGLSYKFIKNIGFFSSYLIAENDNNILNGGLNYNLSTDSNLIFFIKNNINKTTYGISLDVKKLIKE